MTLKKLSTQTQAKATTDTLTNITIPKHRDFPKKKQNSSSKIYISNLNDIGQATIN